MSKYIFIVSVVLTMMCSCGLPYCKKTHLSDEELAWMAKFKENDTICLYGNDLVDTLFVTNMCIYNKNFISIFDLESCNWIEGQNEYLAAVYVDLFLSHKGTNYEGGYSIEKSDRSSNISCSLYLGNLFSDSIILTPNDTSFVVEDGVNAHLGKDMVPINIHKIEWTKNMGVKSIELDDGEILVANKRNNEKMIE